MDWGLFLVFPRGSSNSSLSLSLSPRFPSPLPFLQGIWPDSLFSCALFDSWVGGRIGLWRVSVCVCLQCVWNSRLELRPDRRQEACRWCLQELTADHTVSQGSRPRWRLTDSTPSTFSLSFRPFFLSILPQPPFFLYKWSTAPLYPPNHPS